MALISSANIACGGHAGNRSTMLEAIDLALASNVAVGAHPSFADREGFGRRELQVGASEVADLIARQVKNLALVAQARGVKVSHVKPHGALYNIAARDPVIAESSRAEAVRAIDPGLILFGFGGRRIIEGGTRPGPGRRL